MRESHSKIVCIKLVHLPYLYIWCTVTLTSNFCNMLAKTYANILNHEIFYCL